MKKLVGVVGNELVLQISEVIEERNRFKDSLERIARGFYDGPVEEYAELTLNNDLNNPAAKYKLAMRRSRLKK